MAKLQFKDIVEEKGGPGSGHWGHAGRQGKVGGSVNADVALSIRTGKDRKARQAAAAGKTTRKIAGTPGDFDDDARAVNFITANISKDKSLETAAAGTKAKIVDEIHSRIDPELGVTKAEVNEYIKTWAYTSNDSNQHALSMQQAASEVFDTPLSKWQQYKIDRIHANYRWNNEQISSPGEREKEKAFLRAMYANTQEMLANSGYKPGDTISMTRGIKLEDERGYPTNLPSSPSTSYTGNAMESWTASYITAKNFAGYDYGDVLSQKVPVENIVGSCVSGFGCLNEWEFVVLGSIPGTKVSVE